MRVQVIGGGGREHALAWTLARSAEVEVIICAPGNAGMAAEPKVTCVPIAADDSEGQIRLAQKQHPDLVVVGPEQPLVSGIADRLAEEGMLTIGPSRQAAALEGSKVFAKEQMQRFNIPTAPCHVFDRSDTAIRFVREHPQPWVVKADGLAAGKGVLICQNASEAERAVHQLMDERAFGDAGERILIEELLSGEEVSCIALTDGTTIRLLPSSQDHKRALDGDRGPNTGGMGAYSPAPALTAELEQEVLTRVFRPLLLGMAAAGSPYRGFLYAGLMVGADGPRVLEFNVRLGDPETQALFMRLRSDLAPVLRACAQGTLEHANVAWDSRPAVCVVITAGGYPGSYDKNNVISGLDSVERLPDTKVFHAGTRLLDGQVLTNGGRVLGVTALGQDIRQAQQRAYQAIKLINFTGMTFRRDIAHRALELEHERKTSFDLNGL
jgi:phosphoribosylamine--glycine ligase